MTRFALWPRWAAGLVLAILAAITAAAALAPSAAPAPKAGRYADVVLYRTIAARVAAGEDYYAAAAAEHRAHRYPTTPAVVFREPALAFLLAIAKREAVARAALIALAAGTGLALWRALAALKLGGPTRLAAMILTTTGLACAVAPSAVYMHEVWAGLLIALSLGLWRPERWGAAIAAALAACLVRELALPYLAVMAVLAWADRRPREGLAWLSAIGLFGLIFAAHLRLAGAQHHLGDLASNGWVRLGGADFVIATARWNLLLLTAPGWLIAVALALAVTGLWSRRGPWIARAALTVTGYLAAFAIAGRPDNAYWGLLYAPLLPLGLALAPAALKDLVMRAQGRPATVINAGGSA